MEKCRICLSEKNLIDIFDPNIYKGNVLRELIYTFTNVLIKESDTAPKLVCANCCSFATKVYIYKNRAIENNKRFMTEDAQASSIKSTNNTNKTDLINTPNTSSDKEREIDSSIKYAIQNNRLDITKLKPESPVVLLNPQEINTYFKHFPKEFNENVTNCIETVSKLEMFEHNKFSIPTAWNVNKGRKTKWIDSVVCRKKTTQIPESFNKKKRVQGGGSSQKRRRSKDANPTSKKLLKNNLSVDGSVKTNLKPTDSTTVIQPEVSSTNVPCSKPIDTAIPSSSNIATSTSTSSSSLLPSNTITSTQTDIAIASTSSTITTDLNIPNSAIRTESNDKTESLPSTSESSSKEIPSLLSHSGKSDTMYECSWCQKLFDRQKQLKIHLRVHLKCPVCSNRFTEFLKWEEHLKFDCPITKNLPKIKIKKANNIPELVNKYEDLQKLNADCINNTGIRSTGVPASTSELSQNIEADISNLIINLDDEFVEEMQTPETIVVLPVKEENADLVTLPEIHCNTGIICISDDEDIAEPSSSNTSEQLKTIQNAPLKIKKIPELNYQTPQPQPEAEVHSEAPKSGTEFSPNIKVTERLNTAVINDIDITTTPIDYITNLFKRHIIKSSETKQTQTNGANTDMEMHTNSTGNVIIFTNMVPQLQQYKIPIIIQRNNLKLTSVLVNNPIRFSRNCVTPLSLPPPKNIITNLPVTKAPITKAPVTKAPITNTPITKVPINKVPINKVPIPKLPSTKIPVTKELKQCNFVPTLEPQNVIIRQPTITIPRTYQQNTVMKPLYVCTPNTDGKETVVHTINRNMTRIQPVMITNGSIMMTQHSNQTYQTSITVPRY